MSYISGELIDLTNEEALIASSFDILIAIGVKIIFVI